MKYELSLNLEQSAPVAPQTPAQYLRLKPELPSPVAPQAPAPPVAEPTAPAVQTENA